MTRHDLPDHVQGDSFALPVAFASNDAPRDMTGWKVWFTVKYDPMQADSEALIHKVFTVSGSAVAIELTSAETRPLLPVNYHYDVQLTDDSGQAVRTLLQGRWRITADVTHTA
ncbi:hypothetical protein [Endozoicomonas sp. ALB091]|uniref:hypothetical protein n=1 Tax=Endozoicomonas sp. ALB091 TaxID=3403073 RepID=UPI003BB71868